MMSQFWKEQVGSGQRLVQSRKLSLSRDAEMIKLVNSHAWCSRSSVREGRGWPGQKYPWGWVLTLPELLEPVRHPTLGQEHCHPVSPPPQLLV